MLLHDKMLKLCRSEENSILETTSLFTFFCENKHTRANMSTCVATRGTSLRVNRIFIYNIMLLRVNFQAYSERAEYKLSITICFSEYFLNFGTFGFPNFSS